MINLLCILLPILLIWKIKPSTPFLSAFNNDYLSIESCNALRGFFSLFIVFFHLSQNIYSGTLFLHFTHFGHLAVSIFFFFSGYGLQKSYMKNRNYSKGFLLKRLPSVLFPYIIICFIYWIIYSGLGSVYSLNDFIVAIIKGSPLALFSWYIISILVFYLVFWLLMIICKSRYKLMIAGGIIYNILSIIYCIKIGYAFHWYVSTHLLIIGMIWAVFEKEILGQLKRGYRYVLPLFLIALVLCFVGRMTLFNSSDILSDMFMMCESFLFTVIVLLVTLKFKIGNPILNYFGKISFEIYMCHGIFFLLFHNKLMYINSDFIFCVLTILGTIILSGLLHVINRCILSKYKQIFIK